MFLLEMFEQMSMHILRITKYHMIAFVIYRGFRVHHYQ